MSSVEKQPPTDDASANLEKRADAIQSKKSVTSLRPKIKKDAAYHFAVKLYEALAEKTKIMRPPKIGNWAFSFRQFIASATITEKQFEDVLLEYIQHIGEKYVPKAYSAKTFCEKFVQIAEKMEVEISPPEYVPLPKKQEATEVVEQTEEMKLEYARESDANDLGLEYPSTEYEKFCEEEEERTGHPYFPPNYDPYSETRELSYDEAIMGL